MLPPAPYWKIEEVKADVDCDSAGWNTYLEAGLTPIYFGKKKVVTPENLAETLRTLVDREKRKAAGAQVSPGPTATAVTEPPKPKSRIRTLEQVEQSKYISVPETARLLGYSVRTIERAIKSRQLTAHESAPINGEKGRTTILRTEAEKLFANRRRKPRSDKSQ